MSNDSSYKSMVCVVALLFLVWGAPAFAINPVGTTRLIKTGAAVKYADKLAKYGIKSLNNVDLSLASKSDNIATLLDYQCNAGRISGTQAHRFYKGFNSLDRGDELLLKCFQQESCHVEKYFNSLKKVDNAARVAGKELSRGKIGGSYARMRQVARKGKEECHHMPSRDALEKSGSGISANDGSAIKMDKTDHKKTASFGNSPGAAEYRAKQAQLINEGKFGEAFEMDAIDIESKFPGKYTEAISQAREYAKSMGYYR